MKLGTGMVALPLACALVGLPVACAPAPDQADSPQARGAAFLAENGQREGVVTTASGLQYEVLASGTGASPTPADEVSAHYHGTLIDGRVFDSSVQRGKPLKTTVGGVIKGWQEALQLMRVGDKWKVFIPSELAYGALGAGGLIGPHEVLIFEMELLAIEGREGTPAAQVAPTSEGSAGAGAATATESAATTEGAEAG